MMDILSNLSARITCQQTLFSCVIYGEFLCIHSLGKLIINLILSSILKIGETNPVIQSSIFIITNETTMTLLRRCI